MPANLDEVSDKSEEALGLYRSLYKELNERSQSFPLETRAGCGQTAQPLSRQSFSKNSHAEHEM